MAEDQSTEQVEEIADFGFGGAAEVKRWNAELNLAAKNDKDWIKRGDKVMKRYRDERTVADENDMKFNVLWSNTQTLIPALYMHTPKPQVSRRFKDKNPIAREVARVLERATAYSVDSDTCDFDDLMESAVEEYQLPGRAVTRIVYKPYMVDKRVPVQPISYETTYEPNYETPENPTPVQGKAIYPEGTEIDDITGKGYEMIRAVDYEEAYGVHVFWKDFRMGKARSWKQVPWVAFRSYLSRKELHDRFDSQLGKDEVKRIPLKHRPDTMGSEQQAEDDGAVLLKKAMVWEIWDRIDKKVIWICPDWNETPLDKDEPHLNLHGFFPCTPPLIMTKTTGTMTPVPEYIQYQDQAKELDELTTRINLLVDAIRVTGVYDQNASGVEKILTSASENKLYAISNYASFQDKGGIQGAISWLPLENIIVALREMYLARDKIKQDLYEITGIADIIRGASNPNETAAAQKIKGRFASMRLSKKQKLVAKHAKHVVSLIAEVIAEHFSQETMQKITGLDVSDEMMDIMQNDSMRTFMVDIETDSTIAMDEQEEKQNANEFLRSSAEFLTASMQISQGQPLLVPLLGEMMMFGIRRYRAGRDLEESFEKTLGDIKKKMAADADKAKNQPPQPTPEEKKAQVDMKIKSDEHAQDMDFKQQEHGQDMKQKQESHIIDMQTKVTR